MTPRRAALASALACAVAGTAPGTAAAEETVLATTARPTSLTAYGGVVAWSRFDPATRMYHLRTWAGGQVMEVPVPGRYVPFDVDAGPDARGRPALVYSRCRQDGTEISQFTHVPIARWGRGCDLYRHVVGSAGEQRLRAISGRRTSETLPTLWGSRIAFARMHEPRGRRRGEVPTLHLRTLRGAVVRRVGAGTTGRLLRFDPGGPAIEGPTPTSLDLRERDLVFAWEFIGRSCAIEDPDAEDPLDPPRSTEVWLDASARRARLERSCDATGVFAASFAGATPMWLRRTFEGDTRLRGRPDAGDTAFRSAVAADGDTLVSLRPLGEGYGIFAAR